MSYSPTPAVNITDLLRDGRHFAEKRGDRIYVIDSITGNTIVAYADNNSHNLPTRFVEQMTPTGVKVWVEADANLEINGGREKVAFSPHIISIICQKVAEGSGITKVCEQDGMPDYAQLRQWARLHPWIDQELDRARRDRAESLRDRAVGVAEDAVSSKDPVLADNLRVDTYKWAAGVDHERYNPKTKVEATLNTPTQIVVFTGIQRDVTPVETNTIPEELQKYEE